MIERLLSLAPDPAAESELRREVAAFVHSLQSSARRGDRRQVANAEAVRAKPTDSFRFDGSGLATLTVADVTWDAGRFETPSIAELRARAMTRLALVSAVRPGSGSWTAPARRAWRLPQPRRQDRHDQSARALGRDLARALRRYLETTP